MEESGVIEETADVVMFDADALAARYGAEDREEAREEFAQLIKRSWRDYEENN